MQISAIQEALRAEGVDGWLFYYFHENDPLALRILDLANDHFFSRRWFYLVPANGEPIKLVHRIEDNALDSLPGTRKVYLGWRQLEESLAAMLTGLSRVAMQYSPRNAVPYVSRVDAGVVDLIRSLGVEVQTSADLISRFEATMSKSQLDSHVKAAELLRSTVHEAFRFIKEAIESKGEIAEYTVQQFIVEKFSKSGMTTNSPPIVAVNSNSGMPHYQPTAEKFSIIKKNDFVLIDLWAKMKEPADSVYADITWTGFVGEQVPEKYVKIFDIVAGARDSALNFVRQHWSNSQSLCGWQVDDAARNFIADRGYGDFFIHRTGHSISLEVHGNGTNIDNLETRDERKIIPNTCFSIEPGIYLDEFGVRSEIDVFVGDKDVMVAGGPIQTEVIPILKM